MSPKRGERAAPPPIGDEYDIRFANTEAADGWEHLRATRTPYPTAYHRHARPRATRVSESP